ncbi:ATP-binding protein [Bdellovibrio bacteriovorus]|uniref:ATP-binding protein n=1 Tax=Bdellovibrio bacteriovorus TaxID=959 RepID=UPI0035A6310F
MNDEYRPNPDRILEGIKKEEEKRERGHFRVFFGMCPGVGKTYAMLKAAVEQVRQGADLVVGVVETHGRRETEELLSDLKLISKKKIQYKDTVLEEMDLDAILKLKPQIVLVDELAHTNAPGSRHPKRYQDVIELLEAGISVYSTVNVQHLESRADLVQQITGIKIQERIPDSILDLANQMELIDITAQGLLKRMKEGKVYQGDRAVRAEENFFRETHLMALRELALRYTAERVDQDLQDQMVIQQIMGPWNTQERLLVAVSHSPFSGRLIRATRRMAYGLEAPWVALHIDTGERLSEEDQTMLMRNLALARELGAEVVSLRSSNIAGAIHQVSHERNITQIIMGRPQRRWWEMLGGQGSLLDQLVRKSSAVDVHIIRQEEVPRKKVWRWTPPGFDAAGAAYWNAFWFVMGVSFVSRLLLPLIGYRAVGFVFLIAMMVIGLVTTQGPILFAAVLSALIWNFFFIPPVMTFAINAPEDVMMCVAYLLVALLSGVLAARIRARDRDLEGREERTRALYDLVREFSSSLNSMDICLATSQSLEGLLNGKVKILLTDSEGHLLKKSFNESKLDEKDFALAAWSFENGRNAGWKTETLSQSRCLSLPLKAKDKTMGVLLFYPREKTILNLDQQNLLENVCAQTGMALDRLRLQQQSEQMKVLEVSENLHQALLNSVSHELRTPLTAIIGSASAVMDEKVSANKETREQLAQDIVDSSLRLNQVVENLLDMSRLNSGALRLKKEWVDLEDVLSGLPAKLGRLMAHHKLSVVNYLGSCYAQIDEKLFEHVLLNLLSNAARYAAEGTEITLHLEVENRRILLRILDQGPGIPQDNLKHIFEAFYRVPGSATGGVGLGLAIVKALVEAHGGRVYAQNRRDMSGAEFVVELPYENPPADLEGGR